MMKFKEIIPKIQIKETIKDYFTFSQVLDDVGINEYLIEAINYNIDKMFYMYTDYDCLYDEEYMINSVNYILITHIPDITQVLVKNNLMFSKLFRKWETISDSVENESVASSSYTGYKVEDDYQKNKINSKTKNHNPLNTMILMNHDFRTILNIMRHNLEKLLRTIY